MSDLADKPVTDPKEESSDDFFVTTVKYRLKDKTSGKSLDSKARSCNRIWNYINGLHEQRNVQYSRGARGGFLSSFEIDSYTAGVSKELGVHSTTVQAISKQYVTNRDEAKLPALNWRNDRRSLGWIPFKSSAIQLVGDSVTYCGKTYRFYQSKVIPSNSQVVSGSFNKTPTGKWLINLVVKTKKVFQHNTTVNNIPVTLKTTEQRTVPTKNYFVGIDPGVSTKLTLSDKTKFNRENFSKKFADKHAVAQRKDELIKAENKKLRAEKLPTIRKPVYQARVDEKIANCRLDWTHKITSKIVRRYSGIFIEDLKVQELVKKEDRSKKQNLSQMDCAVYRIKLFLSYKADKLGRVFGKAPAPYTTVTCGACLEQTGPIGEKGLSVREWTCSKCEAFHDRDVNAAQNILRVGQHTYCPAKPKKTRRKGKFRKKQEVQVGDNLVQKPESNSGIPRL